MANKENMKIVIVGHVDHGKSSIIGRLLYDTGSLPPEKMEEIKKISAEHGKQTEFSFLIDNLKEERERGITIDTSQTFFKTDKRDYVIIDAPGHKVFTKNMMTGASLADTSILIVDVFEGIKEQTKRHAFILSMMNLKRNIVVINKMDLVNYSEEIYNKIKSEILEFLSSVDIKPNQVIPISAIKGENTKVKSEEMKWYKGVSLIESLDILEKEVEIEGKPLRLPVQDIYNIDGKSIVVGRIESGSLKTGDKVVILPKKEEMVIKSVEEFGKDRNSAVAGESIGITLIGNGSIERGNIICAANNIPPVVSLINCSLFWMAQEPFTMGEKLVFRCTTQEVPCIIKKIVKKIDSSTLEIIEKDNQILNDTEVGEVQIETEKPVVIEVFTNIPELGRFVLEKNNGEIVAGGIITHLQVK